jgi:DNA-binding transcriptional MerR regulator
VRSNSYREDMTTAEPLRAQTLSISEVSARTGLSSDTLRYYEKAGLVRPVGRSSSGQRRYAADDLEWIGFLLRLRQTGMSIAEMQRYAELRAQGDSSLAERLALLREHRARLHERMRALRASARALHEKIELYEKQLGDQR